MFRKQLDTLLHPKCNHERNVVIRKPLLSFRENKVLESGYRRVDSGRQLRCPAWVGRTADTGPYTCPSLSVHDHEVPAWLERLSP